MGYKLISAQVTQSQSKCTLYVFVPDLCKENNVNPAYSTLIFYIDLSAARSKILTLLGKDDMSPTPWLCGIVFVLGGVPVVLQSVDRVSSQIQYSPLKPLQSRDSVTRIAGLDKYGTVGTVHKCCGKMILQNGRLSCICVTIRSGGSLTAVLQCTIINLRGL